MSARYVIRDLRHLARFETFGGSYRWADFVVAVWRFDHGYSAKAFDTLADVRRYVRRVRRWMGARRRTEQ